MSDFSAFQLQGGADGAFMRHLNAQRDAKSGGFAKGMSNANIALTLGSAIAGVVVSSFALANAKKLQDAQVAAMVAKGGISESDAKSLVKGDHKALFTILLVLASVILGLCVVEIGFRVAKKIENSKK